MRDQRPAMPYTELYFKWRILSIVARVLGAAGAIVFVGLYLILYAIAPNAAPQIAACTFVGLIVVGFFAIVYGIIAAITRKPRTMADVERSLGWTPNPPKGVSWFRADGSKKSYDKATGIWS